MANTVQGLTLRIPNGAPLTPQQGDQNLTIFENFVNALSAAVSASLNPDGTLIAGAINSPTQFSSLQLFADNFIASLSLPVSTNLLANDYIVANPAVTALAYVVGMRIQFKANFANTLACTINFNGLGAQSIVKGVNQPLAANDISANSVVELIYDGFNFQMVGMTPNPASTAAIGPVLLANNIDITNNVQTQNAVSVANIVANRFVSGQFPLPAISGNVANVAHGLPITPFKCDWFLICTDPGGDAGYAQNDTISVYGVSNLLPENAPTFTGGCNATNVFLSLQDVNTNPSVAQKSTGASLTIIKTKWKAFCVAATI